MNNLITLEEISFSIMQLGKINNQIRSNEPLVIYRSDLRTIAKREKLASQLVTGIQAELKSEYNLHLTQVSDDMFVLFSASQATNWPTVETVHRIKDTISHIDSERYISEKENPFND